MGVDYYACKACGESRYEEYVSSCQGCGTSLCTSCLVNKDHDSQWAHHYGYTFDPENPELMKKYEEMGWSIYDKDGIPYYEEGDTLDDSAILEKYCPFCSGEKINEIELYRFIVSKYELDVKKEWKELKNK